MTDCIVPGRPDTYAHRLVDGRLEHAHRVGWRETHGSIPDGHLLHHVCGVKGCINVDHLQPVTPAEHARIHGFGAGLRAYMQAIREATHCRHGHEWTDENTYVAKKCGTRICRACHARIERERRARRAVQSQTVAA